jgi:hypothetical protein
MCLHTIISLGRYFTYCQQLLQAGAQCALQQHVLSRNSTKINSVRVQATKISIIKILTATEIYKVFLDYQMRLHVIKL